MNYDEFIRAKSAITVHRGLESHGELAEHLFPHQRDLTSWALKRGRAAIFADTGLGKAAMLLEWSRHVSEQRGPVIVLAPLAVAQQLEREGRKFGVDCAYARSEDAAHPRITITNYELLEHFDIRRYAGVVIDESSCLKAHDGKRRNLIISSFAATPFKLACTATPSPNDHTELGNHSEFLGIKTRAEMLAEYFVHDGGSTQDWRLKGHAREVFWRWVASWAAVVRLPSDLGYADDGYVLPGLRMREHVLPVDHADYHSEGYLFAPEVRTLQEQRATRRATMDARVAKAAELASGAEPCIVWCELNDEADAVEAAIPDSVQVKGSDDPDEKVRKILDFVDGRARVLVTKVRIAGFGCNFQHCARMVFVGASHSYEGTYQSIRRCLRFGQTREVEVNIIRAENEGAIIANYERKARDHAAMMDAMLLHVRDVMRAEIRGVSREWNDYSPSVEMVLPVRRRNGAEL